MMTRKVFTQLKRLCKNYDPFTQYIDNYRQELSAEKDNARIRKEFDDIMHEYTHDDKRYGIPWGCENCHGEELEANLLSFLNDKGIEVEPRRIWTEDEIARYIVSSNATVFNILKKTMGIFGNNKFYSKEDKAVLKAIYDHYLKNNTVTIKQVADMRKIFVNYIPQLTAVANELD